MKDFTTYCNATFLEGRISSINNFIPMQLGGFAIKVTGEKSRVPPLALHGEIRGHRFSGRMWRENPAASQVKPPTLNQARKDVDVCGCFEISLFCIERSRLAVLKIPPRISGNLRWKRILFNLLGHKKEFMFSRQEFLPRSRLGSRGATVKPGGRMLEVFTMVSPDPIESALFALMSGHVRSKSTF